jgi:uncharacterized phage protein (TIGR02220 family)
MSWAKIDDQFHNHPKLAFLGSMMLPCVGLHVLALSWCSQYLTDGQIPAGQVHKLAGDLDLLLSGGNAVTELAQRLVDVELWEDLGDGLYQIHDYLEYNPSRDDVLAERKATAERVAKLRSARAASHPRNARGNAVTNTSSTVSPVPVPGTTFGSTKEPPIAPQGASPRDEVLTTSNGAEPSREAAEALGGAAEEQLDDELRDARTLLAFLNAKTGRTYSGLVALQLIAARLREGWSVQDCKTMIVRKWRDWHEDAKMATYLRPATLFNRVKLEGYMGELGFTRS